MRTKQVAPWNLKPGMLLAALRNSSESAGSPRGYHLLGRVESVTKGRGAFTGGTVWHVLTSLGERLMYHGRRHNLPAESVVIIVEAAQ